MDTQSNDTVKLSAQVRVMQIIVGALVTGIVMFGGVATTVVMTKGNPKNIAEKDIAGIDQPNPPADAAEANQGPENGPDSGLFGLPVVATLAVAMSIMIIFARFIVPSVIVQNSVQEIANRTPVETLTKADFVPIYQTTLIIASALLEGPALFNLIAFIVEEQSWSLGFAGILALGMMAGFPTIDRVDAWTEEQLRNVQMNPPIRA